MLVLLTRAAEDSARTRARLEALGHRVLLAPVIAIERLDAPWPRAAIDAVVATSSHAFRRVPAAWGPTPEARRLLPLWLVGAQTRDAARAAGFLGPAVVAPNAVMLAVQTNRQRVGRVVYLAGRDRKPDIETALAVTDQPIDLVEIYAANAEGTLPADVTAQFDDPNLVVLHYSRRSAEIFAALSAENALREESIANALHLCLSQDAATPLLSRGWNAKYASLPTEAALLAMVPSPT